jgi:hypothetical protein
VPFSIKIRQPVECIGLAEYPTIKVCIVDNDRTVGIENSADKRVNLVPGWGIGDERVIDSMNIAGGRRDQIRWTNQCVQQYCAVSINDRDINDLGLVI